MKKFFGVAAVRGLALGFMPLALGAAEVELTVSSAASVDRKAATVVSGIPFAQGQVRDLSELSLTEEGRAIPVQFSRLAPWKDGSVRWALLDTQVDLPAGQSVTLTLAREGGNAVPAQPVTVKQEADRVVMATGPLTLSLGTKQPGLIEALSLNGQDILTQAGKGPVIVTEDGREVAAGPPDLVSIEQAGPMRATVCLRGAFPGIHNDLLKYTARFHAFAGRATVKVEFWLENHGADGRGKNGKPEWFAFDSMALDFGLSTGDSTTVHCEDVSASPPFRVLQRCLKQGDRRPYYYDKDFSYTIHAGGAEMKSGHKTDGLVRVQGDGGVLNVGIRHFWQNYEKAIQVDSGSLRLWLWPAEGEWPRPAGGRGSKYSRRLRRLYSEGRIMLPGSVHKGHEFILDVSGQPLAATAADLSTPAFARAPAEYYAQTEALPGLFAAGPVATGNRTADFKLNGVARSAAAAVDPEDAESVFSARSEIADFRLGYMTDQSYWYGWMDFGDLSIPGRGQVSLHYDWPMLVLHEYLRNGSPHALELGTQMTRHLVDIDTSWSDRDPPHLNAVQRGNLVPTWHAGTRESGGAAPGSTFLSGVALYHLLTGDAKAREASLRTAEGLVRAWEAIGKSRVYGGGAKVNMEANGWAIDSFCAVYTLTGDKRWLDEAMKLFDTNVASKRKSHGPHLHSAGRAQIAGQSYVGEDRKYAYAIGPFCNLHRHTQNENVFSLLREGAETPLPSDSFFDGPIYIAGLQAYVGGVRNDPDLLKAARRTVMLAFPESRKPPVFRPDNKDWSERAAMLMRAADVVQYGFSRKGEL